MPLTKKTQILAAVEDAEGVKKTPVGADAILVFEPNIVDQTQRNERVPAGRSLGRQLDTVGRISRQLSFNSDFVGAGNGGGKPPWGKLIRCCGYQEQAVKKYALATITGTFLIGEKVYRSGAEATDYGIALNSTVGATDDLYVAWLVGSAGSGTILGKSSAASGVAAAPGATDPDWWFYNPTSDKTIQISTGAWSGGPTIIPGDILLVQRGAVVVGGVQAVSDGGGPWTTIVASVQWGDVKAGDILVTNVAETATVSGGGVIPLLTPSLTFRHNLDGLVRDLVGARGDFSLAGDVGGPLQWSWTFTGLQDSEDDLLFASGSFSSALSPPRLVGADILIGQGSSGATIPIRRIEVSLNAPVSMRADSFQASGNHHAEVTDRVPRIRLTLDKVGTSVVPWRKRIREGTAVRFALGFGISDANRLVIVANLCQVEEITDDDSEGIAGDVVTLLPRFMSDGVITEEGNNELIFAVVGL